MDSDLRILAKFIVGLNEDNIPAQIRDCAAGRVFDNVSAAIAASGDPLVTSILDIYGKTAGRLGSASVWGHSGKYPLITAAFINALMCHTLELDDVHAKSKSHIGTVVIPAAWAMAEHLALCGRELLTAIIAGYETESRIAMSFGVKEHRKQGWHVTATAGVFGAAAACGKLLGLDEDAMLSCLGLAGAQSMGNWAFLSGSCNCKALNPARAAATGCESALLAAAGMRGPENILTASDGGLYSLMTTRAYPEHLTSGLGTVWEIANVDSKPYPCCRSAHCAIDGILSLTAAHNIKPENISHIDIATYLIGKQQCAETQSSLNPSTPVDAKFSLPYCAAAALTYRNVSLDSFTPEIIAAIKAGGLMEKVSVRADDAFTNAYPDHWGCHVSISCCSGETFEITVSDASGSVCSPLSQQQMAAKAIGLMEKAFPKDAEKFAHLLSGISSCTALPDLFTG